MQNSKFCIKIVDACKIPEEILLGMSYMWSKLNNNKLECVRTDFDPEVIEKFNSKPMICFTAIAQEGMMLHVWTISQLLMIVFPSQSRRNRSKDYPK